MSEREAELVRIDGVRFVAGVIVGERAAPIVKYMAGWKMGRILAYCAKRGWECEVLGERQSPDIDKEGDITSLEEKGGCG